MDNNNEIINNIKEIYRTSPANKIHQLIAKHFIPSVEERKNNAEIPTAILLVEEMLDKIPSIFWETPHKVIEPCCGKGNFVMKIFEKFYNGLKKENPLDYIRIMKEGRIFLIFSIIMLKQKITDLMQKNYLLITII
jgi:hypothetical protein